MLTSLKSRWDGQTLAVATALFLLFALVGCQGKKSADPSETVATQEPVVPTPISSTPETVVPVEPVEAFDQEPVVVSFEDAEKAYNEKDYAGAVSSFEKYTEQNPGNPWGYYMLGLSARKTGNTEAAISAFERSIELDSLHSKSWVNLARANMDAGEPETALDNIDRAIELSSESAITLRLQGRAFHQLGLIEDAVAAYRQAIILDAEDYWSMNNLALVYIEQEKFEDAIPVLAKALELSDNPLFHNNLGMALENTDLYRAAEASYARAIELDEGYENAIGNLARVEDVEGELVEEPVDFNALARKFEMTIAGWIIDSTEAPLVESEVTEPEQDSTQVDAGTESDQEVGDAGEQPTERTEEPVVSEPEGSIEF